MGILEQGRSQRRTWAATRWSVVGTLDGAADEKREASWAYLVAAYRRPMEKYVRRLMSRLRGRPCSADEAESIVQDFLGDCVEKEWLSRADPRKGPFRAFLQIVLRRYVYDRIAYERAQKRTPAADRHVVSMHENDAIAAISDEDREELDDFDRTWAQVAVDRARRRLAEEHERYVVVVDDLIHTDGEGSTDLAERVGVRAKQLPVLKHRALKRFNQIFEQEFAETVGDEQQLLDELRRLAPYLP